MTFRTCSIVSRLTAGWLFSTRETVAGETPATLAIFATDIGNLAYLYSLQPLWNATEIVKEERYTAKLFMKRFISARPWSGTAASFPYATRNRFLHKPHPSLELDEVLFRSRVARAEWRVHGDDIAEWDSRQE